MIYLDTETQNEVNVLIERFGPSIKGHIETLLNFNQSKATDYAQVFRDLSFYMKHGYNPGEQRPKRLMRRAVRNTIQRRINEIQNHA